MTKSGFRFKSGCTINVGFPNPKTDILELPCKTTNFAHQQCRILETRGSLTFDLIQFCTTISVHSVRIFVVVLLKSMRPLQRLCRTIHTKRNIILNGCYGKIPGARSRCIMGTLETGIHVIAIGCVCKIL